MILDVDRQTLDDLAIFDNAYNRLSVFNLFNKTATIGGSARLAEIFNSPFTDSKQVERRIEVLRHIQHNGLKFAADKNTCDFAEFYLRRHYYKKSFPVLTTFFERIVYLFNDTGELYVVQRGVENTLKVLSALFIFAEETTGKLPRQLEEHRLLVNITFQSEGFSLVKQLIKKPKLTPNDIARADHLFRKSAIDKIKTLLNIVYELDVLQSIDATSKKMGFNLPVIITDGKKLLVLKDLFHPFIKSPTPNDIEFNTDKNICFITGTNMGGKSTLLKAVGIAIYLSQLGFPVPASFMETSLFNGLISTINFADDIEKGQSHFYREVLRVKQVAEKINSLGNVFVVFDELFRGTNVKDAHDASLAIISAFAKVNTCFFIVSTHIVEVANQLKENNNISFQYMETSFESDTPIHSYILKPGITEEQLGMWIVNNEKILEIIEKSIAKLGDIL